MQDEEVMSWITLLYRGLLHDRRMLLRLSCAAQEACSCACCGPQTFSPQSHQCFLDRRAGTCREGSIRTPCALHGNCSSPLPSIILPAPSLGEALQIYPAIALVCPQISRNHDFYQYISNSDFAAEYPYSPTRYLVRLDPSKTLVPSHRTGYEIWSCANPLSQVWGKALIHRLPETRQEAMDRNRTVSGGHSDNAPLMSSAEPPSYDSGDIAMRHDASYAPDDTSYSPPMVLSPEIMESKGGAYTTLNTPRTPSSTFDVEDGTYHHHKHHNRVKRFDHREARKTLLKTGAMKLLVTLFFSAAMCVTLKSWEGWRGPIVLSNLEVRIFNSLTIGLSLCLGLNILASLKHYASVFRWSFLTRRYVSLEVFDLILHLGSLAKVTKLMILSSPGFRGKTWLRKFGWFKDVRDDGTKWMWLACLAWLSLNIGSQILVALLSLFWPMENSLLPLFSYGTVIVANLDNWSTDNTSFVIVEDKPRFTESSLEAAWMFGTEATAYPERDFTTLENMTTDLSGLQGAPIYKDDAAWHYRLFNRDPKHPWVNYVASSRTISVQATCEQLEIQNTTLQTTEDMEDWYLMGRKPGTEEYSPYIVTETAWGSITWMASVDEICGTRCTNFTVVRLPDGKFVNDTSLFTCENTLGNVTSSRDAKHDITLRDPADFGAVFGSDDFARIAAGAIAWTGIAWANSDYRQTRSYSQGSKWSPSGELKEEMIENLLMRFTIGAVAAFDDHGIRYSATEQTVVPSQGQQLNVDWSYIFSILGGICFIQFLALCLMVLFANRTIVRDESYFSMAMLLNPVVSRIKSESAMVMSGSEIKDSKALKFKKIKYDYHEGGKGEPNRVAIFFEGEDRRESRKSWAAGSYA